MNNFERVEQSRQRTNPTFPLPTYAKCIRYAVQEAAEADDALMRQEEPHHIRNSQRQPDVKQECGQCGYMILSAAIQAACKTQYKTLSLKDSERRNAAAMFGLIVAHLGGALFDYANDYDTLSESNLLGAYEAWIRFCRIMGWNDEELINETCAAFEAKHAPGIA